MCVQRFSGLWTGGVAVGNAADFLHGDHRVVARSASRTDRRRGDRVRQATSITKGPGARRGLSFHVSLYTFITWPLSAGDTIQHAPAMGRQPALAIFSRAFLVVMSGAHVP